MSPWLGCGAQVCGQPLFGTFLWGCFVDEIHTDGSGVKQIAVGNVGRPHLSSRRLNGTKD